MASMNSEKSTALRILPPIVSCKASCSVEAENATKRIHQKMAPMNLKRPENSKKLVPETLYTDWTRKRAKHRKSAARTVRAAPRSASASTSVSSVAEVVEVVELRKA